jgi:hypothetical protein
MVAVWIRSWFDFPCRALPRSGRDCDHYCSISAISGVMLQISHGLCIQPHLSCADSDAAIQHPLHKIDKADIAKRLSLRGRRVPGFFFYPCAHSSSSINQKWRQFGYDSWSTWAQLNVIKVVRPDNTDVICVYEESDLMLELRKTNSTLLYGKRTSWHPISSRHVRRLWPWYERGSKQRCCLRCYRRA